METQQEISYLKKIIELQDKLLDCYESDDEDSGTECPSSDLPTEQELSYVKKIASLQTKVIESYETDDEEETVSLQTKVIETDSEEESELEKSIYHDSSFYVSDNLRDYLDLEQSLFTDRQLVFSRLIGKLKEDGLVNSDNEIILNNDKAQYLVTHILPKIPEELKNNFSVFSLPKYIEHHFSY